MQLGKMTKPHRYAIHTDVFAAALNICLSSSCCECGDNRRTSSILQNTYDIHTAWCNSEEKTDVVTRTFKSVNVPQN